MSCCHEKEAKELRERNQALQNEISDLTSELAGVDHVRYERDDLTDRVTSLTEAIEDHARGVVTLDELVETATGKRP